MPEAGAPVGRLAIVLHAHMPYVEGFGTYPFGEEWLFDAVSRSHLPVLEKARDLTVSITPVLADQLEDSEVTGRLREFLIRHRIEAAEEDLRSVEDPYREAAEAELNRYGSALASLDSLEGGPLDAFRRAQADRGVELLASSATHAVLPLLATDRGIDIQLATGIASHDRRFGWEGGFWLPECAYSPGLEARLERHGVRHFCVDQSRWEGGDESLAPVRTGPDQLAFTIDWEAVSWLWDLSGYPSWPGYADFHAQSMNGMKIFAIDGSPRDPGAGRLKAAEQAEAFLDSVSERLASRAGRTGSTGLMVFACDMELLGHWWTEGPDWLASVLDGAAGLGIELVTLGQASELAEAREAELMPSTWGKGKDFRTWDSPSQADIVIGARRLELAVCRAAARGLEGSAIERAVRELLAVQSSDWAFLDHTGQAGDYPFDRATSHASAAFEAIESGRSGFPDPRLRSLAPDLDITPMLVP